MDFVEQIVKLWTQIEQAPLLLVPAISLAFLIGGIEYMFLNANIARKDDLIKTLKDQLEAEKRRLPAAKDTPGELVAAAPKPDLRLKMSGGNFLCPLGGRPLQG